MGGAIISLEKFISASAFNSSDFLKSGEVDCRILPILGLQRPPEGGAALVPLIPLGYGVEVPLIPLVTGIVLSTPVVITRCGVLFVPMLCESSYATISCIAGDLSACGACTIPVLIYKAG